MAQRDFVVKNGIVVFGGLLVANSSSSKVGIGNSSPAVTLHITGNDAISVPAGNTGQRPTGANGYIRYNTDANTFEGFANGIWGPIGGGITVAGSNNYIQFNNGNSNLGASANLTWDGNTTLNVSKISAPGTTNLGLSTSNSSGPSITVGYSTPAVLVGNSSVNAASWDTTGFWIKKQRNQSVSSVNDGTTTIDCSNGNIISLSLTGNTTINTTGLQPGFYTIIAVQDATGNRNITWTSSVFKFPGATVPQQTLSASSTDIFSFISDGTYMFGSMLPALG